MQPYLKSNTTRRGFLSTTAALGAGALMPAHTEAKPTGIIVDTHMHTWSGDEAKWPFDHPYTPKGQFTAPEIGATVEHLIEDLDKHGVSHAIIVQTIFHGWDNTYTVHTIQQAPNRFKGHGLIDPTDPKVSDKLDYWMTKHGLSGMRFSPIYYVEGRNGGDAWLTSQAHHRLWKRATELGAVFNMFIHSSQLPRLGQMVDQYPDVKILVDHVSQIDLADDDAQMQLDKLLALSRFPNVSVKVTDLTSVSPSKKYPFEEAMPYMRQVYQAFGADRLLWGTGYPGDVRTHYQRPSLADELALVHNQFQFMSEMDKRKYLGLNAQKLWNLET